MNLRPVQILPLLGCLIMLQSATSAAQGSDPMISLSIGAEFTSGTYGGDVDIEDTYMPLTAVIDYGNVAFRLSVPYLSVSAPQGTVFDPGGNLLPGSGATSTESGMGDVIGSVTFFDVVSSRRLGFAMDVTAKVKFGTADESVGLGTGENDYTIQADLYKFVGDFTWLGSVGYKYRGDPTDIDFDNVLLASVGGSYKVTPDVRAGVFLDYRESSVSGSDDIQELSGFVSRRFGENWKLQFYALTGFTDSSPDWGAGLQIKRIL